MAQAQPYKYVVLPGNNSDLIMKCLQLRGALWQ